MYMHDLYLNYQPKKTRDALTFPFSLLLDF